jgi:hypothetical protein
MLVLKLSDEIEETTKTFKDIQPPVVLLHRRDRSKAYTFFFFLL